MDQVMLRQKFLLANRTEVIQEMGMPLPRPDTHRRQVCSRLIPVVRQEMGMPLPRPTHSRQVCSRIIPVVVRHTAMPDRLGQCLLPTRPPQMNLSFMFLIALGAIRIQESIIIADFEVIAQIQDPSMMTVMGGDTKAITIRE